uniref:TctD transcriptional regulator n=1 Tax=Wildemania schizophylla TaxID=1134705 RepID=A0A126G313_WILSC|nr:hypothetical protein [Wildemania schizophylla]AKS28488.1 hypothetical protein [Wildemania schizophylla]
MSYNLMLVENDNVLSKAIQEYLIDQGFNVKIASDGLEAIKTAKYYKFDLIISDIIMPTVDGYELLDQLKKTGQLSETPFIFLTAKGMTKDRIKGYNMGCHGYLSKPFDPEELVSLVKNLISRNCWFSSKNISKGNMIISPLLADQIYFTPREVSVLKLVIDGLTNKEIATTLSTSIRNIEKYVSKLLHKTNTKNRTLLVKYSIHNKLLSKSFKRRANDGTRTRE